MSSSKNLEFEKTSFLNKSNSAFIEQMYLRFINKDPKLPESWANYFEGPTPAWRFASAVRCRPKPHPSWPAPGCLQGLHGLLGPSCLGG